MRLLISIATGTTLLLAGCSNLIVSKVPMDKRLANEDDHIHGFRYYLSRPYVVVLKPVPLTQTQVLVAMNRDGTFTHLDGSNAGLRSSIEAVKQEHRGSAAVTPVSPAELARMQVILSQGSGENNTIEPVQFKRGNYTQNVIITDQAAAPADQGAAITDEGAAFADAATTGNTPAPAPSTPVKQTPVPGSRKSAVVNGPIQIIFLPDMDEQYAIRSENFVSKSDFSLQFRNGWELTDVSGNHDSTPVAVELIKTISAAIDAAKTLSTSATGKVVGGGGQADAGARGQADRTQARNWYILTRTTVLKPGIYRLNKPWEMGHSELPTGCGLLTKLGLETFTTVELVPVTQKSGTGVVTTLVGVIQVFDTVKGVLTVLDAKTQQPVSLKLDPKTIYLDKMGNPVAEGARGATFLMNSQVTVTAQDGIATSVKREQ
jgi:hypothetical protein